MAKLSDIDFKHYKKQVEKDIAEHKKQMEEVNCPEEVKAAYMGKFHHEGGDPTNRDRMLENYLFLSVATALPSLFFQLPRIQIRSPNRKDLQFSSAILSGLVNATFTDKDKEENQLCIIDAFLPYGYGVMMNAYNSRTKKAANPSLLTGKQSGADANSVEADNEYILYEKPIGVRRSPKFTYLDSSQPFGKGNRISFQHTRTLQNLMDSNLYNLSTNFINYYKARATDPREVELTLYECFWAMDGKTWKLAYVDGWQEPIAWDQTDYSGLPTSHLRFNKIGDVLYNISHGTLGLHAQKELNYLNELWKKHIDNIRNQHIVSEADFTESGLKTLRHNDIGGLVTAKGKLAGAGAVPLQSAPMDPNIFNNIANVREYLKLIMFVSGSKMGGPESDLATVERSKELGNALRSGGLQDAIRDFMVDQVKHRVRNILKLGSPEMMVTLTGENIINPFTGAMLSPGTMVEIGGENGLELDEIIKGDLDLDYVYDIDIVSAQRPDYPVVRKQLMEGIKIGSAASGALSQNGKKFRIDLALEDLFSTFDAIPDAQKYIQDLSEEEKQLLEQTQIANMMAGGPTPEAGAITEGAERVTV
jgi:hypothetical protein